MYTTRKNKFPIYYVVHMRIAGQNVAIISKWFHLFKEDNGIMH